MASGIEGMTELWARVIERWGFPVLVALAAGFVLRNDVLIPLVEEHRIFLRQLGDTQKEISGAIQEQTRLLYRFAPRDASAHEIEGGGT